MSLDPCVKMRLIIHDLEEIITVCSGNQEFKSGPDQDVLARVVRRPHDGVGVFICVNNDGLIEAIGFDDELPSGSTSTLINGKGLTILPLMT